MATALCTVTTINDNTVHFKWTLTQANTDGTPIDGSWSDFCDRSVHFSGTFDSATLVYQGSNVLTSPTYVGITDPQGNAISKTAEGAEQTVERMLWERPLSSGGGASQSVVVSVLARRNHLPRG